MKAFFSLFFRMLRQLAFWLAGHSATPPLAIEIPPRIWYHLLSQRLSVRQRVYLSMVAAGLLAPVVANAQLTIGTPAAICPGQSLTLVPGLSGALTESVSVSATAPAGISVVSSTSTGIVLSTSPTLTSGTYNLTVASSVTTPAVPPVPATTTPLPTITVPIAINSVPVLTPGSLAGSVLGSSLNLGSCSVGSTLSYTVLSGPLSGTVGTNNLTLTANLAGQQLAVACTGGPCPSAITNLTLPVPALQTLNLGNVPTSVCVDAPISLTVLPTTGVDLSAAGLAVTARTTSGTLAVSALGPDGALTINGGQLTVGSNQSLTITASLGGLTLASTTVNINVVQPAIPNQPAAGSLTATLGGTLSLSALCPTGVLVNLSNLADVSGIINIPTTAIGVQSLTIACLDNGCLSPARVVQATVSPILFSVLSNSPVCLDQPLSLTVIPGNFSLSGTNPLVSISVTGPASVSASALDANGVVTVTGLASGVNNLSVVASINGSPVATVGVSATATAVPDPVLTTSLTVLEGTTVSLTALCPTATVSTTGIGGTTLPFLSLPPTTAGVQVLTLLCAGAGTCVSPVTNVTVVTVPIPTISLLPSAPQICVGSPLSITVTGLEAITSPIGLSVVGAPSATVSVANNVITLNGLSSETTTLTVNAGLTVAGVPVVASQTVTVTVLDVPAAPSVATRTGQSYPGGVSSLTVAQNSGNVLFDASCATGSLSYTSSSNVTGTGNVITVPTTSLGVVSYSAVCTNGACVSPTTVISVTVVTPTNQAPTVVNGGIQDPQSATVGIGFTSNVSGAFADPDNNPLTFTATGLPAGLSISTGGVISGTPTVSGPFVVTVTANDGQGGTVSDSFTLNVSPNGAPNVTTPGDQSLTINTPANFTVVASDPEGGPLTYTASNLPPGLNINPNTGVVTGSPSQTGTFGVTVTVADPQNNTSSVGFNVIVNPAAPTNQAPTVVNGGIQDPQSATVGIGFTSNVSGAFADPDNNPLTFTATGLPAGLSISTGGVISGTPTVSGPFVVTVTANDGQGGTVSDSFTLNVSPNGAPNVTTPGDQSLTINTPASFTVVASDPEGGPLTYTASNLPPGLNINPNTGVVTGSPSQTGTFGVTVTVSDPQNNTSSVGFNVTVNPAATPNQAPVVVNGGIPSPQSATVSIGFSTTTAGAFSDPEGGALTYAASNLPNGVAINPTTGLISGAPSVSGIFGVTVTATDPQGASVATGFTLNVSPAATPNQAPVVVNGGIPSPQSATVGIGFSTTTAGAFSDPNGDVLTYAAAGLPGGLSINPTTGVISGSPTESGSFGIVVTANDGKGGSVNAGFTLNVSPVQTPPNPGTPLAVTVVSYNCQNGAITFGRIGGDPNRLVEYMAIGVRGYSTDPNGQIEPSVRADANSSTITVMARYVGDASSEVQFAFNFRAYCDGVTPPNQAPVVVNGGIPSPQSATVGIGFSTTTAGAFSDPNGDVLTYAAAGLPGGLSINPTTGVISGSPTESGSFGIVVTANDGKGGSVNAGFTLNVSPVQTPPNPGTPLAVTVVSYNCQNGAITFGRIGGDPNRLVEYMAIGVRGYSTDPNGQIEPSVRADANSSTITVMARYVGDASSEVQFAFNFRAYCDGVTPPNQPPVVVNGGIPSPQSATVGIGFSTTTAGAFSDPNGDPLTYAAAGLPGGLSINPTTGVISGSPTESGSFGIVVTANDGKGGSVNAGFTLNVSPVQTPPNPGTPLAVTVVSYNCQNGAITFGRIGGDPNRLVEYMAIGVRGYSTDPNGQIEPSVRADANSSTITVMARYVGDASSEVQFAFNFRAYCDGVTPPNQPPVVVNGGIPSPQSATVGIGFSTTTAGAFSDPNSDVLTYAAAGLPGGLSINPTTGVISGSPTESGSFGIVVTANDGKGGSVNAGFTLNVSPAQVSNGAPIVAGTIPNQTATAGVSYNYTFPANTFVDPESQPLSYSATGLPRGLLFSGSTFSGVPTQEGVFLITVQAFDPQGNSASTTFTFTVIPSNDCGSNPATYGQQLQVLQPTYNCATGTIKFNVQGGNGSTIEFGAIGITPFQTNCFETMDTEVAEDVRNDKSNVEPFMIMARQSGQTVTYSFDARAYCRPGGQGNPNGATRLGILEPYGNLQVTVFGNPTAGSEVEVEITGAEGKPLTLRMVDAQGKPMGQHQISKAGAAERLVMPLGKSAGMYILQVSTPTQVQTVKIVRQ